MTKLTKALMGTTCLTLVSALPAAASIINEETDFSDTFAGAYLLPVGTDTVNGSLSCCGDEDFNDFFTFQNLASGDYVLTFATGTHDYDASNADIYLPGSSSPDFSRIYNSTQSFHLSEAGNVTIGVNLGGESSSYSATIASQTSSAPEPSTLLLGATGLVGALTWRRKRTA